MLLGSRYLPEAPLARPLNNHASYEAAVARRALTGQQVRPMVIADRSDPGRFCHAEALEGAVIRAVLGERDRHLWGRAGLPLSLDA